MSENQPANGQKPKKPKKALSKKQPREKVKCAFCDFSCFKGYPMNRHMRIHTGEKPYLCAMCDQSFTQKSSLKEHLWKHTVLHSRHICPHCDATFSLPSDVQHHSNLMHSKADEKMVCVICQAAFEDRYSLLQHQKAHTDMYRYQCLECAFSSKYKDKIILHMGLHNKHNPSRCSACQRTYKSKTSLLNHLFYKHDINMSGDFVEDRVTSAAPKKLLEEQYQIVDEHGNTLELTEADAAAIRNAMQCSSADETLQIMQNEEGTMTVTVVTVAPGIDETLEDIQQNIELNMSGEGLDEGAVSQEAVSQEAVSQEADTVLETSASHA